MTGDMGKIMAEVRVARREGRNISDACARMIGALYQEAGPSASFASCGWIPENSDVLYSELFHDIDVDATPEIRVMADMMSRYLTDNAPRGRVEGWPDLWIREV